MAIPTQEDLMVTLIFGTSALVIGIYFFIFSYISELKEVYGYSQTKTIYEVVARTIAMHIFLIVMTVLFVNAFEIVSGFHIYDGISKILTTNWFQMVKDAEETRTDIKTVALLLGYIKLITVLIIAIAPVALFFTIVTKQFTSCTSARQGEKKGMFGCAFDILVPAIVFLTVFFIHLGFASVLIGGADVSNPDREFLRNIGINWWRAVVTIH